MGHPVLMSFIKVLSFSGGGKGEPFEGDSSQIALEDVPGRVAGVQRVAARVQGQEEEAGRMIRKENVSTLIRLLPSIFFHVHRWRER